MMPSTSYIKDKYVSYVQHKYIYSINNANLYLQEKFNYNFEYNYALDVEGLTQQQYSESQLKSVVMKTLDRNATY